MDRVTLSKSFDGVGQTSSEMHSDVLVREKTMLSPAKTLQPALHKQNRFLLAMDFLVKEPEILARLLEEDSTISTDLVKLLSAQGVLKPAMEALLVIEKYREAGELVAALLFEMDRVESVFFFKSAQLLRHLSLSSPEFLIWIKFNEIPIIVIEENLENSAREMYGRIMMMCSKSKGSTPAQRNTSESLMHSLMSLLLVNTRNT